MLSHDNMTLLGLCKNMLFEQSKEFELSRHFRFLIQIQNYRFGLGGGVYSNCWALGYSVLAPRLDRDLPRLSDQNGLSGFGFVVFLAICPPNFLAITGGRRTAWSVASCFFITPVFDGHVGLDIRVAVAERTCGILAKSCVCAFALGCVAAFDLLQLRHAFRFRSCQWKELSNAVGFKFCLRLIVLG